MEVFPIGGNLKEEGGWTERSIGPLKGPLQSEEGSKGTFEEVVEERGLRGGKPHLILRVRGRGAQGGVPFIQSSDVIKGSRTRKVR